MSETCGSAMFVQENTRLNTNMAAFAWNFVYLFVAVPKGRKIKHLFKSIIEL